MRCVSSAGINDIRASLLIVFEMPRKGIVVFAVKNRLRAIYVREDPNSAELMCRPTTVSTSTAPMSVEREADGGEDFADGLIAGAIGAGAALVDSLIDSTASDPDPAPDTSTDSFDGFGGGETGGGGAGGDF